MRLFLSIFLLLNSLSTLLAQDEYLGSIKSNSQLLQYQNQQKSLFYYNNVRFNADTLSLPFIDDFSTNTLLDYNFQTSQIFDTIFRIIGVCIYESDFQVDNTPLMADTSYTYNFNFTTNQVDSFPLAPISFNEYPGGTCFFGTPLSQNYWPQYYTYTFDLSTGEKLDSNLVTADTVMQSVDLYLANLSPSSKWVDNYAYWNKTFAENPPTIGVATLDGLNEFGLPYNNTVINPVGSADVLTSKPIDLSGMHNDSAIFISFFVQSKGFGDSPNSPDSLILEFKNEYENLWVKAWSISIDELSDNDFKQYYVALRDTNLITGPRYFYEDFQFRFRNIASLSGNNDHWNIDYVRLDKNRALVEQDTVIRDVAFMYDFPNVLQKYSTLPWSQFQAGADNFADSISIQIRDNGQVAGVSAGAFPIKVLVTDSLDTDTIYQLGNLNFNPTQEIKTQVFTPNLDFVKPTFEADSICINAGMGMEPTSRNLLLSNDTTFSQICFDKVMAYDDGSAERAYGLSGSPNEVKKFAYRFEVAHPDTLSGIQVHFSSIDEDVSNLVFSFFAWDSLEINQALSYEHVIGVIENKTPVYIDMVNGFASFAFDTPILVSNKFYIGWVQTDTRNLQIGFDKNSIKGRENMFIYTSSTWTASNLNEQGSPMLRAVLDADYDFPTSIQDVFSSEGATLKVYPNPSSSILNIAIEDKFDDYTLSLFDYTGKLVIQETNVDQLDLSSLNTGIYFLRTFLDGQMFYAKVLKQ